MTIQGYSSIGWTTATVSPCAICEMFSVGGVCLSVYTSNGFTTNYVSVIPVYSIPQPIISYYNYNFQTGNATSHIPSSVDSAVSVAIVEDPSSTRAYQCNFI